jgi:penicillin-binding protein 2
LARRIRVAGKTGTAQAGIFKTADGSILRDAAGDPVEKPDHSWFTGYAPYDKPQFAFVVLAEYSGLAGAEVADIGAEIVERCLAKRAGAAQPMPPNTSVRK